MCEHALSGTLEEFKNVVEINTLVIKQLNDKIAQLEAKLEAMLCGECEKSMLHCTCEESE